MARPEAKQVLLRNAFVAIGIPTEQADNALARFDGDPQVNQQDVDLLLNSVGYPSGYGTVKVVAQTLPILPEED